MQDIAVEENERGNAEHHERELRKKEGDNRHTRRHAAVNAVFRQMVYLERLTANRERGDVVVVMPDNARFETGFKIPFARLRFADDREFKSFEKDGECQRDQGENEIIPGCREFIQRADERNGFLVFVAREKISVKGERQNADDEEYKHRAYDTLEDFLPFVYAFIVFLQTEYSRHHELFADTALIVYLRFGLV